MDKAHLSVFSKYIFINNINEYSFNKIKSLIHIFYLIIIINIKICNGEQFFGGTLGNSGIISPSGSLFLNNGGIDEWDGTFRTGGTYGNGYSCINIPINFTLCKNMDYTKMMVPNLLGHDSLQEAEYHAKSWIPLLRLGCHPDTQLFLCSLFSPICLDRPIYPCRSLCQVVQASCEPRMLPYNYPWPSMLRCDQFPEDHDLCIRPGASNSEQKKIILPEEMDCPSCNQAHTCENVVDNYCRANYVFRAKFKGFHSNSSIQFRKGRLFKPNDSTRRKAKSDFQSFTIEAKDNCCIGKLRVGYPYLVMGIKSNIEERLITFIMPWNGKDRVLKNAVKTFRSMDCSNPLPMSVMALGNRNGTVSTSRKNNKRGIKGRRRRKQGRKSKRRQYEGCRVIPTRRHH